MLDWLLAPIDASRGHDVSVLVSWHARLMVLAWAVLFPGGILAARFFKIMPGQNWPQQLDNRAWWHTHLTTQYAGGVAALVGLWLILRAPGFGTAGDLHRIVGWLTLGLCAVQFLAGWLRGNKGGPTEPAADGSWSGDHYDMTPRRLVFEYVHKSVGYVALLVAVVAIVSGLWLSNAPRWMWLAIALWWAVLVVVFVRLQRRRGAVDTYQAIWGPDPKHPGNQRQPIGWGIRRPE